MAKSMRVESGVDRIGVLPDELLCHILSLAPTKMAVCTSVLSTRWRRLYTLVSTLDFVTDGNADGVLKANQFMNSVDRSLFFRTGDESVERFRLKFHYHIDHLRMDGWIRALVLRNIQELDLCCAYNTAPYLLPIPASLFSCKSLVALKLVSYFQLIGLKIPIKVSLPNLKVLHFGNTVVSCRRIEKLLSSCPVLDDLVLDNCHLVINIGRLKFYICSATLKRLTITRLIFSVKEPCPLIVITCPALVYLNYVQHSAILSANSVAKLTYLKVCDCYYPFASLWLENLLAPCVALETLVLERKLAQKLLNSEIPCLLQHSRLTGLLSHLKTIEFQLFDIADAEIEALVKFIEFFLNNAKVLEKLSVLVGIFPDEQQLKITKAAITLPRVSKKCRVFVDKLG